MIINNFRDIENIIFFDNYKQDYFYFVQLIMRKKDMPEGKMNSAQFVLKTMYIDSLECYRKKEPQIIDMCDKTGARAYIHPMPKSYKTMTKQMLKIISDKIYNDDFQSPQTVAEKSAGVIKGVVPRWVVDLDNVNFESVEMYRSFINHQCEPLNNTNKVITRIRTKNGYHLITEPFNINRFQECIEENKGILSYFNNDIPVVIPDIHKNNPTLLYVNDAMHKKEGSLTGV